MQNKCRVWQSSSSMKLLSSTPCRSVPRALEEPGHIPHRIQKPQLNGIDATKDSCGSKAFCSINIKIKKKLDCRKKSNVIKQNMYKYKLPKVRLLKIKIS